jgi:plastocyanin
MNRRSYGLLVVLVVSATFVIETGGAAPVGAGPYAQATQPTSRPTATVKIDNFAYQPGDLVVAVGTIVTWQNMDDVPHTATSKDDPQVFDSGPLDTDDKFSFTFKKPGKYAYYCKVHPHMTGTVTVK